MATTEPSPLAMAIAEALLGVFRPYGYVTDSSIRDAALIVDQHLDIDRREKEMAALQLALQLNGTKEGWRTQ